MKKQLWRVLALLLLWLGIAGVPFTQPRPALGASFYGLISKGNRYFKNELFREALGYYLRGREKSLKAIEPPFNAGAALYKSEDYVRSIEALTQALQSSRKPEVRSDIYYNLGNNYFQLGDYEKAAAHYIKGLELTPSNLDLKYNLELALKKLEAAKQEEEKRSGEGNGIGKETASKAGKGSGGENGPDKQGRSNSKESAGSPESAGSREKEGQPPPASAGPGKKEGPLNREEAERLIRSVNADQSKIIGDYIKHKLGSAENEKDW